MKKRKKPQYQPQPERTYLTPASPVEAGPGSEAKIEAMRERNSRGEQLWHEADGTLCDRRPVCQARTAGCRVPDARKLGEDRVAHCSPECGPMPASESSL